MGKIGAPGPTSGTTFSTDPHCPLYQMIMGKGMDVFCTNVDHFVIRFLAISVKSKFCVCVPITFVILLPPLIVSVVCSILVMERVWVHGRSKTNTFQLASPFL